MLDRTESAALGPFFATASHDRPPGRPWLPMSDLVTDGVTLGARIEQVRAALSASAGGRPVEDRVAASVAQLGLTARLVAPVLGLAVLGQGVAVDLDDLYWQPELGGPFPLSLPATDPEPVADVQAFLAGPVAALVAATRRAVPVAPAVLWGNVASTVDAAGRLAAAARPDLAARAAAVTAAALAHPLLHGASDRRDGFRRRSCCLIYRIGGTARPRSVCADCVLRP